MRLLPAVAAWAALAAGTGAVARNAPARLDDPKVKGQPTDHCADIDGKTDCSARGEAKAALKSCNENGFSDQVGSHWRTASGTAMHYITEYDMHAGEVVGRWAEHRPMARSTGSPARNNKKTEAERARSGSWGGW